MTPKSGNQFSDKIMLTGHSPEPASLKESMTTMRHIVPLALVLSLLSGYPAAEPPLVRVNTFPNARSLPFFVGIEKGFFSKHGIRIELEFTENSKSQREGLAAGKFELVHSAVDNAV